MSPSVFTDKPVVRLGVKVLFLASAGASGLLAQSSVPLAVSLLVVSIAFGVLDYLLSERISTLVVERITGILEGVYHSCNFGADDDARATVFAPSRFKKDTLRQIGRYYPTNKYSSFRRGLSTSKGMIGLCFRSGERCLEVIRDEPSFKSHLVNKWGFTKDEADQVKTRRSYLAIPLFDSHGNTLAVAYFDSMKKDTFTPETIDNLTRGCIPLSTWVR